MIADATRHGLREGEHHRVPFVWADDATLAPVVFALQHQPRVAVILVAWRARIGLQAVAVGTLTPSTDSNHSFDLSHISARRLSGPPWAAPGHPTARTAENRN